MDSRKTLWNTRGQSVLVLAEAIQTFIFTSIEFGIWDVEYLADIL